MGLWVGHQLLLRTGVSSVGGGSECGGSPALVAHGVLLGWWCVGGLVHQLLLRTGSSSGGGVWVGWFTSSCCARGPPRVVVCGWVGSPALVAHGVLLGWWCVGGLVHQLLLRTGLSFSCGGWGGSVHQLLLRTGLSLVGGGRGWLRHQLLLRTAISLGRGGWGCSGLITSSCCARGSPLVVVGGAARFTSSCCAPGPPSSAGGRIARGSPALVAHGAASFRTGRAGGGGLRGSRPARGCGGARGSGALQRVRAGSIAISSSSRRRPCVWHATRSTLVAEPGPVTAPRGSTSLTSLDRGMAVSMDG
ncbi:hypothetical protein FB388_1403 [Pseudonocardia cypriaca]|uniref:Uncharacterized protein n=1 Tax=Pseudonocardia cypriaca TaxID=882449 RepID=A0A543GDA4_9PSEU|nr:hypothetical protein FB388_1403 [Pseudonocardia cypriaca]